MRLFLYEDLTDIYLDNTIQCLDIALYTSYTLFFGLTPISSGIILQRNLNVEIKKEFKVKNKTSAEH
jgi:hypothetical protein